MTTLYSRFMGEDWRRFIDLARPCSNATFKLSGPAGGRHGLQPAGSAAAHDEPIEVASLSLPPFPNIRIDFSFGLGISDPSPLHRFGINTKLESPEVSKLVVLGIPFAKKVFVVDSSKEYIPLILGQKLGIAITRELIDMGVALPVRFGGESAACGVPDLDPGTPKVSWVVPE